MVPIHCCLTASFQLEEKINQSMESRGSVDVLVGVLSCGELVESYGKVIQALRSVQEGQPQH